MWNRLLFALDAFDSGRTALDFTAALATAEGADVRVLHIRELSRLARVPPLESPAEAQELVDDALFRLRMAGLGAEGMVCTVPEALVADRIADEASHWGCDAIVLGSRRLRGISRLSGQGVSERLLRRSPLPVVVAPAPAGAPQRLNHREKGAVRRP